MHTFLSSWVQRSSTAGLLPCGEEKPLAGLRSVMHRAVLKQERRSGITCGRSDQNKVTSAIPVNDGMNCKQAVSFKQRVFCKTRLVFIPLIPCCFNPLANFGQP